MSASRASGRSAIRLGVSTCLLGEAVRYDGGHKHSRFLTQELGPFVEWVSVCPEVEAGLGTPRPAMRLVGDAASPTLLEIQSGRDHTRTLTRYAARRVRALRALDLGGYVLKKDSPSCGFTRVKVYSDRGMPRRDGRGLFASALIDAFPNLPIEDEGRLNDPRLRENFIERVFAYRRLRELFEGRWMNGAVVAFHTAHKLQLMAHSTQAYRALGRHVAALPRRGARKAWREHYEREFMAALAKLATPGRNTNVLQHAAGHMKKTLDSDSRHELAASIDDYQAGLVPLIVPITLLRHHVRRLAVTYLNDQTYLAPHPKELMLRNHV